MESPRLPRFKRAASVPVIQLTERDHEIIRLVNRHRFLRSSHIVSLVGGSSQQLLRRLSLLYHHGFLERPRAQIDYFHKPGSRHIVYGLGNKGGAVLEREPGETVRQLSWGEKNRAVGRIFLEHALLISDVMVAIELACRKSDGIKLLTGDELTSAHNGDGKPQSFRWQVNIGKGVKLGVVPDRVFGLEFADGNRIFYFLEADRGTMPVKRDKLAQTSFYRKLLAYEATWSQGIHRALFGFHRFRVLTVTTSAARVSSLVEARAELERGHGLFLFADYPSLIAHGDILTYLFHSGRKGGRETLI